MRVNHTSQQSTVASRSGHKLAARTRTTKRPEFSTTQHQQFSAGKNPWDVTPTPFCTITQMQKASRLHLKRFPPPKNTRHRVAENSSLSPCANLRNEFRPSLAATAGTQEIKRARLPGYSHARPFSSPTLCGLNPNFALLTLGLRKSPPTFASTLSSLMPFRTNSLAPRENSAHNTADALSTTTFDHIYFEAALQCKCTHAIGEEHVLHKPTVRRSTHSCSPLCWKQ